MKCFVLLRHNVEHGPFSLEELIAQNIMVGDLIWIEGQSQLWKHPEEIEALQPFIKTSEVRENNNKSSFESVMAKSFFVALPTKPERPEIGEEKSLEFQTAIFEPAEKQQGQQAFFSEPSVSTYHQKTFSKLHAILWSGCIIAALLFSAILINDIVNTYSANPTLFTAAALPAPDNAETTDESPFQNALITEVIPIDTVTMKPVKHQPQKINLEKLVQLQANDYQVGLLGGIKNLRMLVLNKSTYLLERVTFELQYLKPNGTVLKTENLALRYIAAKSSKSLAVPASKRGVKIAYHIKTVRPEPNSNALLNL